MGTTAEGRLHLEEPRLEHMDGYLEFCRQLKASGSTYYSFHDPDQYETWRHTLARQWEDEKAGINLPEGYVPCSHFFLVEDRRVVGCVSIRHHLTDALRKFGGHIGYATLPEKWGQGYGTRQLRLALAEARKLGIERALLTCDLNNPASARVMEKNGGIFEGMSEMTVDGVTRRVKRYWIDTRV